LINFIHRRHLNVNSDGHLTVGGINTIELAERFATPLYVVDAERIREKYRQFYDALSSAYPKILVCYAYKANSNMAICKILERMGAGAEVVSGGELYISSLVGVKPEKIVFNGVSKSFDELEMAVNLKVGLINIESILELHHLNNVSSEIGEKASVGIRVNLDVSALTHPYVSTGLYVNKFGLDLDEALKAYKIASQLDSLTVKGVHAHIGSQITSPEPFKEEVTKLFDFVGLLKDRLGLDIECVDLGGGLGIGYDEMSKAMTPLDYASTIMPIIHDKIRQFNLSKPTLIFEPGRCLVADSCLLLSRVNYVKKIREISWVLIDAGMNDLIRPALYEAYHRLIVANKVSSKPVEKYSIGGPVCESADVVGKDMVLPEVESGDVIAILDAGAYGLSMSSQYNSRPRAAVVLIDNGIVDVVRRRESYADLVSHDLLPARLSGR